MESRSPSREVVFLFVATIILVAAVRSTTSKDWCNHMAPNRRPRSLLPYDRQQTKAEYRQLVYLNNRLLRLHRQHHAERRRRHRRLQLQGDVLPPRSGRRTTPPGNEGVTTIASWPSSRRGRPVSPPPSSGHLLSTSGPGSGLEQTSRSPPNPGPGVSHLSGRGK